ncbi:protein dispatched homolog 1-like [Lytechinus variegatus]|uniref:protein dispatched homolog 1-like n=1 Tax=Lytechinus variegatus TaxID=7654 RepID=UPI001BB1FD15|nr:protein dispatched homolog 1-like [Lytechinus variegatus]XP_041460162.1 protein dispatched homolog 1-like [Lytechinus variegatus]XP_041460164.1 protein dispatched homolog 1-like [Lytechinus variegatus]
MESKVDTSADDDSKVDTSAVGDENQNVSRNNLWEKEKGEQETQKTTTGLWHRYVCFLVRFPSIVLLLVLLFVVATGVLAVFFSPIPSFSDPTEGFQARGTVISGRLKAYERMTAETQLFFPNPSEMSSNVSRRSLPESPRHRGERDAGSDTALYVETCSAYLSYRLRMVYRSSGSSDMFTADVMKAVCQHDTVKFRSQDIFNQSCGLYDQTGDCCPTWSLGFVVALIAGKDSCDDINQSDVERAKTLLHECIQYYTSGCLESDANCTDVPSNCTYLGNIHKILHYLTPSEFADNVENDNYDLEVALVLSSLWSYHDDTLSVYESHMGTSSLKSNLLEIIAIGAGIKFNVFDKFVFSDSVFIAIGCVCVILIIWVYVGSLFVTVMTMISIILSMVVAFFLYHVIYRIPFFPFINVITVILIIGVGADDCFVYVDIWKATKNEIGEGKEKLVPILLDTLKHAATTMFVTSLTTSAALFAGVVSTITALRCFSVFAGSAILVNFALTLTWIPAAVMIHEKYFTWEEGKNSSCECCGCWYAVGRLYDRIANIGRKIFENYLPGVITKLRYLWIIVLSALGIGGFCVVFVAPRLRLPSQSEFQVFRTSNIFEQYDQIYKGLFSFEGDSARLMPAIIVWGVEPVDNGNHWDADGEGSTVLDESFDPTSSEAQQWLYDLCIDFKNSSFHDNDAESGDEFCFIDDFRTFMEDGTCIHPLTGDDLNPCCNHTSFPYSSDLFSQCSIAFTEIQCELYGCESSSPGLRFNSDNEIVALIMYLQTNVEESQDFTAMNQFWEDLNGWVEDQIIAAPTGVKRGWFISAGDYQLSFFDLQRGLATGAPLSVGVSLAVAACVLLLAIRNILVTLYAIYSIACAVFVVIASVVLMGWELNIFESIVLSLAVGLSVDFTIHLGVAYRQSTAFDRKSRSMYALRSLSAAITLAAFSTFIAGACMLPATVLSYVQLGTFLTLVMAISWVYGIFLFVSLCRTIGPEGMFAQLSRSCCRRTPRVTPLEGGDPDKKVQKGVPLDDDVAVVSVISLPNEKLPAE